MNVDWIQQITHTRHFEEKWKKIQHCIILYCFFGEDISKTRASGFIRFPNARKHLKPRGRRPRGFKSILAPFRAAIHICLTFAQIKQIKKVWARVKRESQVHSYASRILKSSGKMLFLRESRVPFVISIAYVKHISCYLFFLFFPIL